VAISPGFETQLHRRSLGAHTLSESHLFSHCPNVPACKFQRNRRGFDLELEPGNTTSPDAPTHPVPRAARPGGPGHRGRPLHASHLHWPRTRPNTSKPSQTAVRTAKNSASAFFGPGRCFCSRLRWHAAQSRTQVRRARRRFLMRRLGGTPLWSRIADGFGPAPCAPARTADAPMHMASNERTRHHSRH